MRHWKTILIACVLATVPATSAFSADAGPVAPFGDHLLEALAEDPTEVSVIALTEGPAEAPAQRAGLLGAEVTWTYHLIDGFAATVPVHALAEMAADPAIERITLDRPVEPIMDISHQAIEADDGWAAGYDGAGITVAVLDTGIDTTHPFFTGAIASCVSTIGGLVSPECTDSDGHGTHVAGTVASRDDTYPGVAPAAQLAVVRVLHALGSGTSSDIIAGMEWVADNQDNVSPPIRATTMSIGYLDPGCGDDSDPMAQAANNLVEAGQFFSVAAGNSGHDSCTIDGAAAASKVTTIAAVDDRSTVSQDDDVIAEFSSGGGDQLAKPDISFPGVGITSAYIGSGVLIATMDGTSMATPHAAGTAALLFQQDPTLTPTQVKDTITGNAVTNSNTGTSWDSVYGHGLGNACTSLGLSTCESGGGGGGGGGGNSAPTASFTYSCTDLTCDFDGTGSSDPDGDALSYSWDFGDGNTATGATVTHTFASGGDYTVTLTVDDGSATDTDSQVVSVSDSSGSGITLDANGYKVKGRHHADLSWSGATSTDVDVYRDGAVIATTPNDGAYTDAIGQRGGGSYTYQVCEAGTTTCSNQATVTF